MYIAYFRQSQNSISYDDIFVHHSLLLQPHKTNDETNVQRVVPMAMKDKKQSRTKLSFIFVIYLFVLVDSFGQNKEAQVFLCYLCKR